MSTWYYLYNLATGALIAECAESPAVTVAQGLRSYPSRPTQEGMIWSAEAMEFVPGPGVRVLSRVAFIQRLTHDERHVIRAARATDPIVDDLMYQLEVADQIDLDSPTINGALDYLAAVGLITAIRVEVISG